MPDRDKEAQADRNKRTLLTARLPDDGTKALIEAAAEKAGESVGAFIATTMRRELQPGTAAEAEQASVALLIRRARRRAAEAAQDAAECVSLGRIADARSLLAEAAQQLDLAEQRERE